LASTDVISLALRQLVQGRPEFLRDTCGRVGATDLGDVVEAAGERVGDFSE